MSANRDGDSRSWVLATVDEFEGRLTRYAIRLLGDEHSARDVVQYTFLRLCDAVPGEVQSHIGPWLFRVCRNRSLDMLRKNGRVESLGAAKATSASLRTVVCLDCENIREHDNCLTTFRHALRSQSLPTGDVPDNPPCVSNPNASE